MPLVLNQVCQHSEAKIEECPSNTCSYSVGCAYTRLLCESPVFAFFLLTLICVTLRSRDPFKYFVRHVLYVFVFFCFCIDEKKFFKKV